MPRQLLGTAIAANTITTTQLQTTVVNQISAGGGPRVSSLIYPGNDTAGNTVGGQTVYINGSGFETNNAIYINGNAVPSKSFISAGNLSFTTPALSAGIYPVYVINTDNGATAIFVPGYISSAEPAWVTSAGSLNADQDEASAWSYSLSASGDAPITYALAAGSSLPGGVSLAANGLISGTISSPSGNATTYTFSVVATDAQNQDSTRQFTVTTSTGEGVLFANNVLLIHADGTNNKNNHHFLDSSNNNFTITRNGNATQGTFSPFGDNWSNYFDGTGDYLNTSNNAAFTFNTGDLTVEAWIYQTATSASTYRVLLGDNVYGSAGGWTLYSYNNALNLWKGSGGGGVEVIAPAGTITLNTWTHIAWTRSGSSNRLFINGTQVGSTTSDSTNYTSNACYIAANKLGTLPFMGYMSNVRLVKGTAVYTSNFTLSTTPLTAIANTSLLTCQSNRFIDNSTNAFTITRNGDVSVQKFSPFALTAAYSTSTIGGSGYFDGTGDWLSFGAQSAFNCGTTTDFCMEAWVYRIGSSLHIWSAHYAGQADGFYFTSVGFNVYSGGGGGAGITSLTKSVPAYAWSHLVLTRQNNRLRYFLNGELIGTSTSSVQVNTDGNAVGINGGVNFTGDAGYIAESRFIKGSVPLAYNTAVTTTNTQIFIPPTSPISTTSQNANSSQVIALVSYTNAGIFDQTMMNVLETVGDAKVSTAQYKYGTGSIALDGTGDWLVSPVSTNFDFGTGDFTIECWFRLNSLASNYYVIGGNYNAGASDEWLFQVQNNGSIRFLTSADSTFASPSPAITTNQWYHLAATRSGSTIRLFIDGTSIRSYTNANSLGSSSKKLYWGIQANESSWPFNGYLDDIRITKGYARYTSNFTAPSSAFKDK